MTTRFDQAPGDPPETPAVEPVPRVGLWDRLRQKEADEAEDPVLADPLDHWQPIRDDDSW